MSKSPIMFNCDHCGNEIIVKFLIPGELANCKFCKKNVIVPEVKKEFITKNYDGECNDKKEIDLIKKSRKKLNKKITEIIKLSKSNQHHYNLWFNYNTKPILRLMRGNTFGHPLYKYFGKKRNSFFIYTQFNISNSSEKKKFEKLIKLKNENKKLNKGNDFIEIHNFNTERHCYLKCSKTDVKFISTSILQILNKVLEINIEDLNLDIEDVGFVQFNTPNISSNAEQDPFLNNFLPIIGMIIFFIGVIYFNSNNDFFSNNSSVSSNSLQKRSTSYYLCNWCSDTYTGRGFTTFMYIVNRVEREDSPINSYCSRRCAIEWIRSKGREPLHVN